MPEAEPTSAGNLPPEPTSFVGRHGELGAVKHLLTWSRLVTLTGVGGSGKTRLAVRAAQQLRRAFPDGVRFVDLTAMRTPKPLVPQDRDPGPLTYLVMTTLGVRESGVGTPTQQLIAHLRPRRTLLVVDNCEHLISACAVLTDALLRGCPELAILATSREPLLVTGEALFPVPALAVPAPGERLSVATAQQYDSVALFLVRAQAAVPEFTLTERNVDAVGELCRRLDGLPLALELAAARVRVLSPGQILARLDDRFTLLIRGSRSGPQRQQTLRACVDWSFDLCTAPERRLWARLSVFAGGLELDAAERVCADRDLPQADVLGLVTELVDKSILVREHADDCRDGPARYRMLETVRDYGQDRLAEAGEQVVLRGRHRDWYRQLAAGACRDWAGDRQPSGLARLRREHANLGAAVEFSLTEPGGPDVVLGLLTSLPWSYWRAPGLLGAGRRWLDLALAQATAPTAVRARALLANSQLAFWQGDTAVATRLLDEGTELARRTRAQPELARAVYLHGAGAMFAGDLRAAVDNLDRARAILAELPQPDQDLYPHLLLALAVAAALTGDLDLAGTAYDEAVVIIEPRGDGVHRSQALSVGGLLAWVQGDLPRAHAQAVQGIRLRRAWESDDRYSTAQCLEILAWITADQQRHPRAAVLLGTADTLWAAIGTSITAFGHYVEHHDACARHVRTALGDAAFTDAYRTGQAMTYQETLAYVLDESAQPMQPHRRDTPGPLTHPQRPDPLTRRERQVAGLLAEGRSNREIAAALVISPRTVESHVENILTKLAFTNRAQVAAWAAASPGASADTGEPR